MRLCTNLNQINLFWCVIFVCWKSYRVKLILVHQRDIRAQIIHFAFSIKQILHYRHANKSKRRREKVTFRQCCIFDGSVKIDGCLVIFMHPDKHLQQDPAFNSPLRYPSHTPACLCSGQHTSVVLNEASRTVYCGCKYQWKMENSEPASGSRAIQMSLAVCWATGIHHFWWCSSGKHGN